jgi:hypothetical protein
MSSKALIKLQGGLGNILFQISAIYCYSIKHNKEFIVGKNKTLPTGKDFNVYEKTLLKNINFSEKLQSKLIYCEPNFHYNELPNFNTDVLFYGYFQSEKYFENYKREITDLFSFECEIPKIIKDIINNNKTCSIHVRRGDYIKYPNHHPTLDITYYNDAINLIESDVVFLVFSDDIEWCKRNFRNINKDFVFIEKTEDYVDLKIMSLCTHNIIANSTFSWWGAWLNKNENKKVIAPNQWFGEAYSKNNTKDLYCPNWIKI